MSGVTDGSQHLGPLVRGAEMHEAFSTHGRNRLATPSANVLLRLLTLAPSPAWVRTTLARYAEARGQLLHGAMSFALIKGAQRKDNTRAWFYIDNHMRPYTGRFTVRKGWRMQDKRVRPGSSDYWIHDQDGRPLLRLNSPSHESMTHLLRPAARILRDGLAHAGATDTRVALVFDRAGAFAGEMAALRDAGFDFVTYEPGSYPRLMLSEFTDELMLNDEPTAVGR